MQRAVSAVCCPAWALPLFDAVSQSVFKIESQPVIPSLHAVGAVDGMYRRLIHSCALGVCERAPLGVQCKSTAWAAAVSNRRSYRGPLGWLVIV